MSGEIGNAGEDRRPPAVLAVDDDENNLLILKRPLIKEGFEFLTASSGKEALEILASCDVDLVLLDWMMPEMTGLETLKAIKENPEWRGIPVIMVTARVASEDLKAALDAGANDYLKKPVETMELLARTRAGLRESRIQKGLVESNERLLTLNRLKSDFLAIVSHDLRSPLNAIVGFSNMLLEDKLGPLDEKKIRPIEIIRKSARRQLALIDNLLDLAKIESGAMRLERVKRRVSVIVWECVEAMSSSAEIKNISLRFTTPENEPMAFVDAGRIAQAVNNLLGNAIKFTPEGGWVDIAVESGADSMTVRVKDNGPGIPAGDAARVFDKFHSVGSDKAGEKGSGLGLTISKKIIERHGGRIWAESPADGGSEFCFTVPLEPPPEMERPAGESVSYL